MRIQPLPHSHRAQAPRMDRIPPRPPRKRLDRRYLSTRYGKIEGPFDRAEAPRRHLRRDFLIRPECWLLSGSPRSEKRQSRQLLVQSLILGLSQSAVDHGRISSFSPDYQESHMLGLTT